MTKAHFAIGTIADLWCGMDGDQCGLAIQEYKKALDLEPSNEEALRNLAYSIYRVEGPDKSEAETYYRKALALDTNDPEVFCGVAAIDAQRSWQDVGLAKTELQLPGGKTLIDSPSCNQVRDRNLARVEEGIALLTRGLQIRSNSTDLLGFLSWLYSDRAELQCHNRPAYKADKNAARRWDRLRKEISKRKADNSPFLKCPPPPPPMIGNSY
jgi:tetratricopeptide (TPR) repeat protein